MTENFTGVHLKCDLKGPTASLVVPTRDTRIESVENELSVPAEGSRNPQTSAPFYVFIHLF